MRGMRRELFWRGFKQGWRETRVSETVIFACALAGVASAAVILLARSAQ